MGADFDVQSPQKMSPQLLCARSETVQAFEAVKNEIGFREEL